MSEPAMFIVLLVVVVLAIVFRDAIRAAVTWAGLTALVCAKVAVETAGAIALLVIGGCLVAVGFSVMGIARLLGWAER